jgi:hypothetical protein
MGTVFNSVFAQNYFRLSGDMTIKSKSSSGDQAITMGMVYFDRNFRQIIYNISFPESETWLTTDSITYIIVNDSIVANHASIGMAEFSVFNLALNSHLPNFGLKNSSYHVETVEVDEGNVITTWAPQESMKDKMGNILVSTKDKKLFGVVFMNAEGEVLRKQFFEEYLNISGIAFPGRIVEIGYSPEGQSYQISNFRNLKLNELENNSNYNYVLPNGSSL